MDSRARIRLDERERAKRPQLFASLEAAYPLQFVEDGVVDGAILFGELPAQVGPDVPTIVFAESQADRAPSAVRLTSAGELEPLLRGTSITATASGGALPAGSALAEAADGVVWSASGARQYVACPPVETAKADSLLARLLRSPDLGTVALLHFVRGVLRRWGLEFPPLRAAFVLDDPNLHRPSYGWADFAELARSTAQHRYHVAVATVPADCWYAHPEAARLFRENPDGLSLAVHGFQHLRGELGVSAAPSAAHEALAGARRLIDGFVRRTGLHVDPVVIPPHGDLAQPFIGAMVSHGFEAVVNGGFPANYDPAASTERSGSLGPAHFMPGGVCFIRRDYPFEVTPNYAMLGLADVPILLGCHHQDLAVGVDRFKEVAATVNAHGEVDWTSLGGLIGANCYRRIDAGTMHFRLLTRSARLMIPAGVDQMVVEVPSEDAELGRELLTLSGPEGRISAVLKEPGRWRADVKPGRWELRLSRASGPEAVAPARVSAGALLRRAACEVRDRLAPIRGGLKRTV